MTNKKICVFNGISGCACETDLSIEMGAKSVPIDKLSECKIIKENGIENMQVIDMADKCGFKRSDFLINEKRSHHTSRCLESRSITLIIGKCSEIILCHFDKTEFYYNYKAAPNPATINNEYNR